MQRLGLFIIILFLLIQPKTGFSQASLVPVYHEVYDWLHYQQILGNAPLYNYEALPLTRGEITKLLQDIDTKRIRNGDRKTRRSYLREFSVDSLRTQDRYTVFQGPGKFYERFANGLLDDMEPHFYVWNSDASTIAFDLVGTAAGTLVEDGDEILVRPFTFILPLDHMVRSQTLLVFTTNSIP